MDKGRYREELRALEESCKPIDEAIARQSVTSEEVAEAIEDIMEKIEWENVVHEKDASKTKLSMYELQIKALEAYQPTISKTETTSCEWCEIARACEYEVTFFKDDDRWATERSLLPKYCPNCGADIRKTKEELKRIEAIRLEEIKQNRRERAIETVRNKPIECCRTLQEFQSWAKENGKTSGWAFYQWKRRIAK